MRRRDHGRLAAPAARVYAALDLGTHNCRMLVAESAGERPFRVVDSFSRVVRLGEGLGFGRRLAEAAMARALEALRVCAERIASGPACAARGASPPKPAGGPRTA